MSDTPRFKTGDLAWLTTRRGAWVYGHVPGQDWHRVPLERGAPVTIIRAARAMDLPRWMQRMAGYGGANPTGRSFAYQRSRNLWLTLVEGRMILIEDQILNRRAFKPRKRPDE